MDQTSLDAPLPQAEPTMTPSRSHAWRHFWMGLRWGVGLLIIWLVADRAITLWQHDDLRHVEFHVAWLILSAIVYVLGWIPAVIVWRRMLCTDEASIAYIPCSRAYYAGHLGKYIPGKAAVLAVRAALLKPWGINIWSSMITSTLETLATMSVGLLLPITLILSGAVNGPDILSQLTMNVAVERVEGGIDHHTEKELIVAIVVMLLIVPTLGWIGSGIMVRVLLKLKPNWNLRGHNWSIPWSSWLLLSIGWGIHGVSYGLTLRGVSGAPLNWLDWPMWTAAVSWATAGAFFVFLIPGGLGVREGLLIEFLHLQPDIGSRLAVVSALTLRLVWLLGEFTIATALFFCVRPSQNEFDSAKTDTTGIPRSD